MLAEPTMQRTIGCQPDLDPTVPASRHLSCDRRLDRHTPRSDAPDLFPDLILISDVDEDQRFRSDLHQIQRLITRLPSSDQAVAESPRTGSSAGSAATATDHLELPDTRPTTSEDPESIVGLP